jgi:hypothetical protein
MPYLHREVGFSEFARAAVPGRSALPRISDSGNWACLREGNRVQGGGV